MTATPPRNVPSRIGSVASRRPHGEPSPEPSPTSRSGSALAGVNVSVEGGIRFRRHQRTGWLHHHSAQSECNAAGSPMRVMSARPSGLKVGTRVDVALEPTAPDVIEPDLKRIARKRDGRSDRRGVSLPIRGPARNSISNNNVDLSNFDGFWICKRASLHSI